MVGNGPNSNAERWSSAMIVREFGSSSARTQGLQTRDLSHTLRVMHRQLAFVAKQKLWRPSRMARALGL
jgi:hypothetical protein